MEVLRWLNRCNYFIKLFYLIFESLEKVNWFFFRLGLRRQKIINFEFGGSESIFCRIFFLFGFTFSVCPWLSFPKCIYRIFSFCCPIPFLFLDFRTSFGRILELSWVIRLLWIARSHSFPLLMFIKCGSYQFTQTKWLFVWSIWTRWVPHSSRKVLFFFLPCTFDGSKLCYAPVTSYKMRIIHLPFSMYSIYDVKIRGFSWGKRMGVICIVFLCL